MWQEPLQQQRRQAITCRSAATQQRLPAADTRRRCCAASAHERLSPLVYCCTSSHGSGLFAQRHSLSGLGLISDWQRTVSRPASSHLGAECGDRLQNEGSAAAASTRQQEAAETSRSTLAELQAADPVTADKKGDSSSGSAEGSSGPGSDGSGSTRGSSRAAGSGLRRTSSLRRRTDSLQRSMCAGQEQDSNDDKEAGSHTLSGRASQAVRGAFQTSYTVLFYNTVVRLLKAIGADAFFGWVTPRLEHGYATLAGVWHKLPDGRRRPFSLANNYDPDFSIPTEYVAQEFPFGDIDLEYPPGYEPRIAHLLSLSMKIVYEHNDVIEDLVERHWGLECCAIIETVSTTPSEADASSDTDALTDGGSGDGGSGGRQDTIPGSEGARQTRRDVTQGRQQAGADGSSSGIGVGSGGRTGDMTVKRRGEASFLPSSKALVLRSEGAMVVAFRGTEATNLLNWQTNITINMTRHKTMGGVHDGFYAALFHRPAGGGASLFEDIVQELRCAPGEDEDGQKDCDEPVFITGHSLGGAIASVFAQALAVKEPELAARIAGVYTWGEPRVGDAAFRDVFERAYGDRSFRIRNAGDIVPFLLPQWLGYRHRGRELFLTSFGGMKHDPEDIRRAALRENLGFPLLYIYHIMAGRLWRRESWLRTLYRLSFAFVAPGFTSHFPSNYEINVRGSLADGGKCVPVRISAGGGGLAGQGQSGGGKPTTGEDSRRRAARREEAAALHEE